MISRYTAVALVFFCGSALFAASPVAMLSSVGAVRVAGTEMSASTVALWPLVSGDRIETLASAAVVILPDKSRVTISPGSVAQVEAKGGSVAVHMLSSATGSKSPGTESHASPIIALGHKLSPRSPEAGDDQNTPILPGFHHR